jgi:hypothetical protein
MGFSNLALRALAIIRGRIACCWLGINPRVTVWRKELCRRAVYRLASGSAAKALQTGYGRSLSGQAPSSSSRCSKTSRVEHARLKNAATRSQIEAV